MRHLLWPLGVLVAFGIGAGAGYLPRAGRGDREEVARLQAQVEALETRLRARESRVAGASGPGAGRRSFAGYGDEGLNQAMARVAPATRVTRADRAGASAAPVEERLTAGRVQPSKLTPAQAAALERFYSFFDPNVTGPPRWQRFRQLTDDLRSMGKAATDALMQVLSSTGNSSDERRTAATLLGDLGAAEAQPLLQAILDKDSDVLLRRAAASGLRRLDLPETAPYFQAIMANPAEDRFVRMSAASGLAQLGQAQGVQGLAQIFDEANGDGRGRDMAFRAIRSLDDSRAVPFMRGLVLSDAEVGYRLQAINFLSAQGDRQAVASLQQVVNSPTEQPSLRDAAAKAITTIGGTK